MRFFFSFKFLGNRYVVFIEYELVSINSCRIVIRLLFDWISLLFIRFVLFISSIIVFYRNEYMEGDIFLDRFIYLVILFVFSIILLIIRPNIISLLLGWDGLGLISYLLVIYYQNRKSYNAGIITALTNRLGDVALLLRIAWIVNCGDWNFVYYLLGNFDNYKIRFILRILVVLAAITKSAQVPFSAWLPEAMAAPTPVSSLVHSSTLVTAGIYLLIRFYRIIDLFVLKCLALLGLITMLIARIRANLEYDLKKIIALSTLRQLGIIVVILRLGEPELAFFHLLVHAVFKALLFMCAGLIIHLYGNIQDIRFIGNISIKIPLLRRYFILANLSLCGIPFLRGFFSKDLIYEVFSIHLVRFFIYLIYYLSIGITVCYSFRLINFVILGNFNYFSINLINENFSFMIKRIGIIAILVVYLGSLIKWVYLIPYFIYLRLWIKLITLAIILLGVILGILFFSFKFYLKSIKYLEFFKGLVFIHYIHFFRIRINFRVLNYRKLIYFRLDQGWSEYIGRQGLFYNISLLRKLMQTLFKGNLKILLLLIFLVIVIIIFLIYYLDSLS